MMIRLVLLSLLVADTLSLELWDKYCGKDLTNALAEACRDRGYNSPFEPTYQHTPPATTKQSTTTASAPGAAEQTSTTTASAPGAAEQTSTTTASAPSAAEETAKGTVPSTSSKPRVKRQQSTPNTDTVQNLPAMYTHKCCTQGCTIPELEEYCAPLPPTTTPTATTTTTITTPTTTTTTTTTTTAAAPENKE